MGRPLVTVKSCHPRRLGEARSAFAVSLIVSSSFVPYSDSCLVTDKKCLGEAKADSALRTMDIGLEDLRQRSETHLALANRPSLDFQPVRRALHLPRYVVLKLFPESIWVL
jgi:hypothetical protein